MTSPPPADLPEFASLSAWNTLYPDMSISAVLMVGFNQLSHMQMNSRLLRIRSLSTSSILLTNDLTFYDISVCPLHCFNSSSLVILTELFQGVGYRTQG